MGIIKYVISLRGARAIIHLRRSPPPVLSQVNLLSSSRFQDTSISLFSSQRLSLYGDSCEASKDDSRLEARSGELPLISEHSLP